MNRLLLTTQIQHAQFTGFTKGTDIEEHQGGGEEGPRKVTDGGDERFLGIVHRISGVEKIEVSTKSRPKQDVLVVG